MKNLEELLQTRVRSISGPPSLAVPPPEPPRTSVVTTLCKPIQTTLPEVLRTAAPTLKQSVVTILIKPVQSTLPEEIRKTAAERLLYLESVEQVKRTATAGMTDPEACLAAAALHPEWFPILSRSGHRGGSQLDWNNWRNWTKKLKQAEIRLGRRNPTREEKIEALADGYRRGWNDPRPKYPEFYEQFNRIYFHPNCQTVAESYRNTVSILRKTRPDALIPLEQDVRYYLAHLPKELFIREREGDVAWRNKVCDYAERDWSAIAPGTMIIGDSRPFDTRVQIPAPDGSGKPISVRPTLSALMDAKSWYFVSWMITTEAVNTMDQIRLLAQYCCVTGGVPPAEAYFDNGLDYNAQGFSTPMILGDKPYSIFQSLGIRLTNSTPYNGRAKTIEPNFKNVMQRFDKKFPDYLGSNPAGRTDGAAWHDRHPEDLPTLDQFCAIFVSWLQAYHQDPKNGVIHQGASPAEVWNSRPQTAAHTPEELVEAFMLPEGARQIGRGQSVTIRNTRYYTDDVRYGEKVLVKRSPFGDDTIGLYDLTGARIGTGATREAVKALARGDEAELAKLRERISRQKAMARSVKLLALDLKGGRPSGSPLEEMLIAGTDVRLVSRGTIHPVKGLSHTYRRLAPAEDVYPSAQKSDDAPSVPLADLVLHEDRETAALAEIHAAIARKRQQIPTDSEGLEEIHNFITKKGDRDDE